MTERIWHVLQVTANHEKKVGRHLSVRGLEHFVPLYKERSRWSDRTVILERPLFPGYVFIQLSPQNRIAAVSTPGVIRLLGVSQSNTVSADEIQRIKDGLANGYILRPHPQIATGTQVRVRSGVFEGAVGKVAELRQRCRVVIELTAVKQCFSLEVGFDEVEALSRPLLPEPVVRPKAADKPA